MALNDLLFYLHIEMPSASTRRYRGEWGLQKKSNDGLYKFLVINCVEDAARKVAKVHQSFFRLSIIESDAAAI